ncbi:MAG: TRL domain-containing protein [Myxococcaceae bacterium]
MKKLLLAAAVASLSSGCAAIGPIGTIFTSVTLPQSWRSPTAQDVGNATVMGEVDGEACASSILGLVALGEAGYDSALKAALKQKAGATTMYDVRTDSRLFSILGIYSQFCTVVHGTAIGTGSAGPAVTP